MSMVKLEMQLEMQLVEVKTKMQSMIAHWRKEWIEGVTKWSEQIKIKSLTKDTVSVVLPYNATIEYCLISFRRNDLKGPNGFEVLYDDHSYDATSATYYVNRSGKNLNSVPKNLAVDIFRYFATSFGGKFSDAIIERNSNNSNYSCQYLWIGDENKHHYEIIRSLLSRGSSNFAFEVDGWELVNTDIIRLDGKLQAAHYITPLLWELRRHQTAKMIEFHFRHRSAQMILRAKKFFEILDCNQYGMVHVALSHLYVELVDPIRDVEIAKGNKVSEEIKRNQMKAFDFEDERGERREREYWGKAMTNPNFVAYLGDSDEEQSVSLTVADVRFLICLLIDAQFDQQETMENIKAEEAGARFPTHSDNFYNFNPPHLTGTLAKLVLSRKLAEYTAGQDEILTGTFALLAPMALTNIVAQYLPVDILA